MIIRAPVRTRDRWGEGHFGAKRGDRTHRGVDFVAHPGSVVLSHVAGRVTKIGFAYSDDLSYRYVQVLDEAGARIRYFYVDPAVPVGAVVVPMTPIGTAQDLDRRYPDITPHVHLEVITASGPVDPFNYLKGSL